MSHARPIIDLSQAIVLYLQNYPDRNDGEFEEYYGPEASAAKAKVRDILNEAMKVHVDWNGLALIEGGNRVKTVIQDRHPELSSKALSSIGHYYTYLMR